MRDCHFWYTLPVAVRTVWYGRRPGHASRRERRCRCRGRERVRRPRARQGGHQEVLEFRQLPDPRERRGRKQRAGALDDGEAKLSGGIL